MSDRLISDAELLDYLDGKSSPRVERILLESPELQAEVAALKKMNRRFLRAFRDLERPDPEVMAAVAMGTATLEQKLLVNAYLKRSEEGRAEMEDLRAFLAPMLPPERPRRRQLLAVLSLTTAHARHTPGLDKPAQDNATAGSLPQLETRAREHANWVFDISQDQLGASIRVTVRAVPLTGEYWQLRGTIRQGAEPIAGARITMRGPQPVRRTKTTTSGNDGEYILNRLMIGTYTLRVYLDNDLAELATVRLSNE